MQFLIWDRQMDGGHGPSWWACRCRSPPDPAGLIRGFPRKHPGSRRVGEPLLALGAVRIRGAEEKTGRQEKSLSEWRFYLRLLLRSTGLLSRPSCCHEAFMMVFMILFFFLYGDFFSFVNVP